VELVNPENNVQMLKMKSNQDFSKLDNQKLSDEQEVTQQKKWFILLPSNRFKIFWNFVIIFLLMYTATFVPF